MKLYISLVMQYIKEKIQDINQNHFAILLALIAALCVYGGYSIDNSYLQEMANRAAKVSFFIAYALGLIKTLGTLRLDVWKEIIENKNEPLAKVVGALIIGGALCIFL